MINDTCLYQKMTNLVDESKVWSIAEVINEKNGRQLEEHGISRRLLTCNLQVAIFTDI